MITEWYKRSEIALQLIIQRQPNKGILYTIIVKAVEDSLVIYWGADGERRSPYVNNRLISKSVPFLVRCR